MGMKTFVVALSLVFLSSVVLTTTASADRQNGKGNCSGGVCTQQGKACPAGTCSKAGTPYAQDVKYGSAANCRHIECHKRPPQLAASFIAGRNTTLFHSRYLQARDGSVPGADVTNCDPKS